MDKQKSMLQALWVKAHAMDKELEIDCGGKSEARQFRMSLYNAVKGVKDGRVPATEELREAVTNCSLGWKEDNPNVLVIRQKVLSKLMLTVAGILGNEKPLVDQEKAATDASADRMLERLAVSERPKNPFYER